MLAYDLETGILKQRMWPAVSNCTAAVRWLERYYCFQGIRFLRFNPVTGAVPPRYPRDARDYFMRCPGRGEPLLEWGGVESDPFKGNLGKGKGNVWILQDWIPPHANSIQRSHKLPSAESNPWSPKVRWLIRGTVILFTSFTF